MEELEDYELFDLSGDKYVIKVSKREANALDLDHLRRFRKLAQLKNMAAPSEKWADMSASVVQSPQNETVWQPRQPPRAATSQQCSAAVCASYPQATSSPLPQSTLRATGKAGGQFSVENTKIFLVECESHAVEIRKRYTPDHVWETISDSLYNCQKLNYSAAQLKEKMRNLKCAYEKAKKGQGAFRHYFMLMKKIYDDPLPPVLSPLQEAVPLYEERSVEVPSPSTSKETSSEQCARKESVGGDVGVMPDMFHVMLEITADHDIPTEQHLEDKATTCESAVGDGADDNANYLRSPDNVSTMACEWRSPARKKMANGSTSDARSTPPRTPKRKAAKKTDLVWDKEEQNQLLKECLKFKKCVQKEATTNEVWKNIASNLGKSGIETSWQLCKLKFDSLAKFFQSSLLPVGGFLGGIKWPYYDTLCQIFDVPENYVYPEDSNPTRGPQIWIDTSVTLLLSLYKARKGLFDKTDSHIRKDLLFREIAASMGQFDVYVTGKQCKAHYSEMKAEFMKEYDACRRTGAAPSQWKWYETMLPLFEGTATLEAPFSFSVGTTNQYCVRGELVKEVDAEKGTRTRTSSEREPKKQEKKDGKPQRATYKTVQQRSLDLRERDVAAREGVLEEIRQMREGQRKAQEEHMAFIKKFFEERKSKE